MGTNALKILKIDVNELLELLNKAYADEWLAYYQYWLGAKLVKGTMRETAMNEFIEHANDELRHAEMVADRILSLGGTPALEPRLWYDLTNCGYTPPEDSHIKTLLEQNIEAERCAIDVYNKLADITKDKDPITYNMVVEILTDEIEHEDDLEQVLEDYIDKKTPIK